MVLGFISCKKELDAGEATGAFKKDGSGNCSPITVNGIYRVDSTVTGDHYVDVQVVSDNIGTFDIKSDTIQGLSFSKTGTIGEGLNTIRLFASGKPAAAGTFTFVIRFGASSCTFDVTVFGTTAGAAIYTLGGSPGNCTGFTVAGSYEAGTAMESTNFVNFVVNVTTLGSYNITTNTINGISFSGAGVFTTTGIQGVTLTASGIPAAAGDFTYVVSSPTGNCSFLLTTAVAGPGTSSYVLGGSPGSCSGAVQSGIYMQGLTLNTTNTLTLNITVTALGSYSLTTAPLNDVTFSASGNFTTLGAQTIVLRGNGTPAASGSFNHVVSGGGNTCIVPVTYLPPAPPASFTLQGSPGNCSGAVLAGNYYTGTPLNASNTVTLQVNVATAGIYTITTGNVNGISFSKTGVFAATGIQSVVLNASGTPLGAGAFNYTATGGGNCTFSVTASAPPPAAFTMNCGSITVNGTYNNGTALGTGNTVSVPVNVTTAGAYTLTTTLNGITFSKSGVFVSTGNQVVILNGSGTPNTIGTNTFTLTGPSGSCNFDVTVTNVSTFRWEFNVGTDHYEGDCVATLVSANEILIQSSDLLLFKLNLANGAGALGTGSYSGTSSAGKHTKQFQYSVSYISAVGVSPTNLTTVVTTYNTSPGLIEGTFSGTVVDISLTPRTLTGGKFKAQF